MKPTYKFTHQRVWTPTEFKPDSMVNIEYYPDELKEGKQYASLMFPYEEDRNKKWIEGSINLFTELAQNGALTNNKKEYNSPLNADGINMDFVFTLKALANFAGYLINSTSWQEQEIKDFDKMEFQNRLNKIMQLLK